METVTDLRLGNEALTAEQFEKPVADYLRVATAAPEVTIADVGANVTAISEAYEAAKVQGVEVLTVPELSITGYSTADLFHNQHVLEQTEVGLDILAQQTVNGPALLVGAPIRMDSRLFNCAVMLAEGRIVGAIPKTFLANNKEFYEERWFSSGDGVAKRTTRIAGQDIPLGTDLLFEVNGTVVGAEICEDMFARSSPAGDAAFSGAHVVFNQSASNELIGKASKRRTLISAFTETTATAYAYASAGKGESVADVVYGGHQIIADDGRIAVERKPFATERTPLIYDVDRTYLDHERIVSHTWAKEAGAVQAAKTYRRLLVSVPQPADKRLLRPVEALPYVPSDPETLDERCEEIFTTMAHAMAQRTEDASSEALVLGLSGGLDSTLALLTSMYTCDILGKPYDFIHTLTMPAVASSERTQDNATMLATAVGSSHRVVPISELTATQLSGLGHDPALEDLAYENTQARLRTANLMNYANMVHGFVVGTGDMSEIAKGWSTFNGDHMSMYNPNNNVPKTLVSHLVRWYAEHRATPDVKTILLDILDTPISPELTGSGNLSQTTEDLIGPYDLSDFFMFEHLRYGSRPAKIGFLAVRAFEGKYDDATVANWLNVFLAMHTRSQWKRDVAANGPKLGSTAQSPRGDLRMAPNTGPNWYLKLANLSLAT